MNYNRLFTKLSVSALSLLAVTTSAMAATGTVDAEGGLRLREESSTTAAILTKIPTGTEVEVTAISEDGWYQVSYDGQTGFVAGDYLTVSEADANALPVILDPIYGYVAEGPLNVRTGPSTDTSPATILAQGAVVKIIDTLDDWYQTEKGYISAQYVNIITEEEANALTQTSSKGQQVVDYAMQFLGCRYVYGGTTPSGFDCSGFTQYVYKQFGVSINRSSRDQINNGVAVERSDLQVGDILLFAQNGSGSISHAGLYIGNNQMIHASSPSTGVIVSSTVSGYYSTGYVGARRVI